MLLSPLTKMYLVFFLILLTILNVHSSENQNLKQFLMQILQLKQIRNWILDPGDHAEEFHKSGIPISLNNLKDHQDLNVRFLFAETVANVVTELSQLKNKRLVHIIVGNFNTEDVKQLSEHAFLQYWMTDLSFTNLSFAHVCRYNVFTESFMEETNPSLVFQSFTTNMHLHAVKVVMFENIASTWTGNRFGGRDGLMLAEVMKRLNATPVYVKTHRGDFGTVLPNNTLTGILGFLSSREADLSMNTRILLGDADEYVDFTYPHDQDNIIVALPIEYVSRDQATLRALPIWQLSISFAVAILFATYLKCTTKLPLSDMLIVSIQLLLGSGVQLASFKPSRILLMSVLVYFFYQTTLYQSNLASVLSLKETKRQLVTMQQVSESSFTFKAHNVTFYPLEMVKHNTDTKSVLEVLSRTTFLPSAYFSKTLYQCPSHGFVSISRVFDNFANSIKDEKGYRKKCYYKVKEYFTSVKQTFSLTKGSPLLSRLNKIIRAIIEAGLQNYWEKMIRTFYEDRKVDSPTKGTLKEVEWAFLGLSVGLMISTGVFLNELRQKTKFFY